MATGNHAAPKRWSRKRKLSVATAALLAVAATALALFLIIGQWVGTVTPDVTEANLEVTVGFIDDILCAEGEATGVGTDTITFSWTPSLTVFNGETTEPPTPCRVRVQYDAPLTNTENLVLLGFNPPPGVTGVFDGTGSFTDTCGAVLQPGAGADTRVKLELDGSTLDPITFGPDDGFHFLDEASFDGSQCLPGWTP